MPKSKVQRKNQLPRNYLAPGHKRPPSHKKRFSKAKDVPELASLSVKRSLVASQGGGQFAANTLYNQMDVQLLDYQRAVQVAGAYQHYRIKKVTMTFKPSSDTFIVGGQATKPRLYYMIDKSGAIPTNVSLEGLKAMGAKPKDLDENNVVVSWRPSVLEASLYTQAGGGVAVSGNKYEISPWITTTANVINAGAFIPSAVNHLGLYWYVDMSVAGGYQYSVEIEVQFQFKKPLTNLFSSIEAIPAQMAEFNDSPDGIVGGGDGV